jgi:hypothetical protein
LDVAVFAAAADADAVVGEWWDVGVDASTGLRYGDGDSVRGGLEAIADFIRGGCSMTNKKED